jgi:fucose permease
MVSPRSQYVRLTAFFFAVAFMWSFISNILGVVLAEISAGLEINHLESGSIFSFFSIGFTTGAFMAGKYLDIHRVRRVAQFAIGLFIAGTLTISLVDSYSALLATNLVTGFSGGLLTTMVSSGVSRINAENRSGALNIMEIFFSLGAIAAPVIVTSILLVGTWRYAYGFCAFMGTLLFAFLFVCPERLGEFDGGLSSGGQGNPRYFFLLRQHIFLIGLIVFFALGGLEWGSSVWLPTILENVKGLPQTISKLSLSFFWVGVFASRLIYFFLVRHLPVGRLMIFSSLSLVIALGLLQMELLVFATCGATLLFGLSLGGLFPTMLGALIDRAPQASTALAGLSMVSASLGSNLMPLAVGGIAETHGLDAGQSVFFAVGVAIFFLITIFSLISANSSPSADLVDRTEGGLAKEEVT